MGAMLDAALGSGLGSASSERKLVARALAARSRLRPGEVWALGPSGRWTEIVLSCPVLSCLVLCGSVLVLFCSWIPRWCGVVCFGTPYRVGTRGMAWDVDWVGLCAAALSIALFQDPVKPHFVCLKRSHSRPTTRGETTEARPPARQHHTGTSGTPEARLAWQLARHPAVICAPGRAFDPS